MTEKAKEKPARSPTGKRAATARQERLAAALRANLGRRKAQARERAEGERDEDEVDRARSQISPSGPDDERR